MGLRWIKKRMANQISSIVFIIITITFVIGGYNAYNFISRELLTHKMNELNLESKVISNQIVTIFERAKITTTQLSLHEEIVSFLRTSTDKSNLVSNPYYRSTLNTLKHTKESDSLYFVAWVANEKANFYLDSLGVIPQNDYIVSERPWYKPATSGAELIFTEPYLVWDTGELVISCIKPLKEANKYLGFVCIDINLESIPYYFKEAKKGPNDLNFLISNTGTYIYSNLMGKTNQQNINNPDDPLYTFKDQIKSSTTTLPLIKFQNKDYYLYTYKLPESDWQLISLIDQSVITNQLKDFRRYFIALASTMLLISIVIVYGSIHRATKPFRQLLIFAKNIEDGDLDKNIPENYLARQDEVGILSKSFQMTIDVFRNENSILEKKITEKNQELENQYAFILEAEKAASLGNLVAGVAHEINTPLGVSLTTATYLDQVNSSARRDLSSGQMTKDQLRDLMTIMNDSMKLLIINLQRAADLVKSFKKVAVDQSSDSIDQFDLSLHVDSVILSLLHEYKNLPITITNNIHPDIILKTYPGSLSQVLTNLIMNSLTHGFPNKSKGNIRIDAEEHGDMIKLYYEDDGVGIPETTIKKIYEPFFTTNRINGNSGLGMHIVMNLITQKLKGTIMCESPASGGVFFEISIPKQVPTS